MKLSLTLAGIAVIGASLAGCGGGGDGDTDAYCKEVKAAQSDFKALSSGDAGGFDDAFDAFHDLAKAAPDKVADDWKTVDGAMTTIQEAFKDAGISLSDLDEMQSGKIPEGADLSKINDLGSTFEDLDSDDVTKATQNISEHAKAECDIDLDE